jgi:hypothetical protein
MSRPVDSEFKCEITEVIRVLLFSGEIIPEEENIEACFILALTFILDRPTVYV